MATTTNFGWTTPDNTAYVKDGASAIRTLGSSIDTTLGSFFNIKQVVTSFYATQIGNASSTYADTNLTATITPTSANNKIIVFANLASLGRNGGNANNCLDIRLLRGATTLQERFNIAQTNATTSSWIGSELFIHFDAPATTAATTYKVQAKNPANSSVCVIHTGDSYSNIVLLEVEA